MKTNLIIATYGGRYYKYSNVEKDYYLRYNLLILNQINTNIEQITIMKPKIIKDHIEIIDYYNFNDIDISNIKHKIKIYECDNIGISYGQFLMGISKTPDFDYYIFIEDDYVPFMDFFDEQLINEYKKINEDIFLCSYINKHTTYNINLLSEYDNIFDKLGSKTIDCMIPDFSLGIISQHSINKLFLKFGSIDNIIDIFNINVALSKMWHYQILFGFILNISEILIYDFSHKYYNIFYESSIKNIKILNNDKKNLNLPIFIPIDIFFINYPLNELTLSLESTEKIKFINKIRYLEHLIKK